MMQKQAIDKQLIEKRFSANYHTYDDYAKIQAQVAEVLFSLLNSSYDKVLEIGCGTGLLTKKLAQLNAGKYYINDLCKEAEKYALSTDLPKEKMIFLAGDAETTEFPAELDLIVSSSTIQWFEDLDKFFKKCANNLKPNGELVISTYVSGNYNEINTAFSKTLHYRTSDEISNLAAKYFKIKTIKLQKKTLYFDNLHEVLMHIKRTGTNALSTSVLTKSELKCATEKYEQLRTAQGLPLTYAPAYFKFVKA